MAQDRTAADARSWTSEHIVLSHFSLGRHHDITDRVTAAATAGYDGIGLYIGDYVRLREADQLGVLHELLARHDIPLTDIEVLRGWGSVGLADERYAQLEADAWEMADRFGCRYIQAIGPVVEGPVVEGPAESWAEAGRRFGELCDRAADHGLVVGLEFLPFTNIVDADAGRAIVEEAGRDNGGLCVDIWHHTRGSNDLDQIRRLPGELVTGIQMNDGPLRPTNPDDYVDDCLRFRVPPGEGEMNAVDFVEALLRIGADVPWQMEVCNDAAWEPPGLAHVQASIDGMRTVLAQARSRM